MLFNSYLFLFGFLPVALAGYELAGRVHRKAVIVWLGLCSLVFYAWWQPLLLILLIGSIAFNYLAAALISGAIPSPVRPRIWLYIAVISDILLLGYYKYFFPTLNGIGAMLHSGWHWAGVALPLGISFFTLTQIAYLVDLYRGSAEKQDIPSYVLFVTFFPHLIAGPILHHRQMMPQFQKERFGLKMQDFTVGLTWFILGLGKKVLIADSLAKTANTAFQVHAPMEAGAAWVGAIAYALQLYFDFSGYSDMALGLARMFSIDFPLNFDSPYKSASGIELWQRWHMTLTSYIFMYIYHPVQRQVLRRRLKLGKGISRKERAEPSVFLLVVAFPLMFTTIVAGVWHGAGLQFLAFGLLQGVLLSINHAWRLFRRSGKVRQEAFHPAAQFCVRRLSVGLTFICTVVSVAFFRADSAGQALSLVASMAGLHGHGALAQPFSEAGSPIPALQLAKVAGGLLIVWALPNTQQILSRFRPSLDHRAWNAEGVPALLRWAPTTAWSLSMAALLFVCMVNLGDASAFLYFQF